MKERMQSKNFHALSFVFWVMYFLIIILFNQRLVFCIQASNIEDNYYLAFEDSFENGDTSSWNFPNDWATNNNNGDYYIQAQTSNGIKLISPLNYTDYRFKVKLRIHDGFAAIGYRQGFSGYSLEIMPGLLYLCSYSGRGKEWRDGIASSNAPILTNTWHTVEINDVDSNLQVIVDGMVYIDFVDTEPIFAGNIGINVHDATSAGVDFDDIQVYNFEYNSNPWTQTKGPSGGIINTIEISPIDQNIIYAAGLGGGIFKSTDSGSTWIMLKQVAHPKTQFYDLYISSDAQTVYVRTDLFHKSTDGGKTWRTSDSIGGLSAMAMFTINSSVLVAGTWRGHVYVSIDGGNSWQDITNNLPGERISDIAIGNYSEFWIGTSNGTNGRLYYTSNGGTNWVQKNLGQQTKTDISSIFIDPENTENVYVGMIDVNNEMFNPVSDRYLVKTSDNGATWIPLYIPRTDASVNVIGGNANIIYVGSGSGVFKSTDKGLNWTEISPPDRLADSSSSEIAITPDNDQLLFLPFRGGIIKSLDQGASWSKSIEGLKNTIISLFAVSSETGNGIVYASGVSGEGVFKTTNFGDNWTNITANGITHPYGDEIVINPHNKEEVWYVADIGEVFKATDSGMTWTKTINPSGSGFRFGSVYALAISPSDDSIIYALKNGFGIFKSNDYGNSWQFLHQSEIDYTYSIAVHPTDPNIVYSGFNPKPFQNWAMVRQSSDGGESWRTALHVPNATSVSSIAIDPNKPETVYAGSTSDAGGIIWVSNDSGDNWTNLNDKFNFVNIHTMVIDPNNSNIAYVGIWGGGTYKTVDGGTSWDRLTNDPTISASAIIIDHRDSNVIYIADRTAPRIYQTVDRGNTWSTYFDAGAAHYRVLCAAIAPGNPRLIYASIFRYGGPMEGDLFLIDNGVGTSITGTLPRLPVALAVDPTNNNIVIVSLHGYGVYKTTDSGETWNDISGAGSGLPQSAQVGFNALVISPNDSNLIYLMGGCDVDTDFNHTGVDASDMHTVYKSTNGGYNWINLNDGNLGTNSGSIKGLSISPINPDVLYIGTLKGIFQSMDGGGTWSNISNGLGFKHFAGINISQNGSRIYAPTLGGGVYGGDININSLVTWDSDNSINVPIYHILIAIDPNQSQTLYASSYPGGIFKSENQGDSWIECNFGLPSFEIQDPIRQGYYAFSIAPTNTDVLYLGLYGIGVYKSTDGGNTWRPIHGISQVMRGKGITSIIVDSTNSEHVFVATEEGIYFTEDGGSNWSDNNSGLATTDVRVLANDRTNKIYAGTKGYELCNFDPNDSMWHQMSGFGKFGTFWPIWNNRPLYQYTSLLFHPSDPNVIYFGTFPSGIFKSSDGGQTWREKNVGWKNDGVFSLVFHPKNTDIIYAGTYNGINRSINAGESWMSWDQGWADEQWVFSIDFDPRDPNIMYACSKNGEKEGTGTLDFHGTVMKSTDGGETWYEITRGLNVDQEFYKIIVDINSPDILYLATQSEGVYISYDNGNLWKPWNRGLSNLTSGTNGNNVTNTLVQSADGQYLYFGSSGSGVWRRTLVPILPVNKLSADVKNHKIILKWNFEDMNNNFSHYNIYKSTTPFSNISGLTPYATISNVSEKTFIDNDVQVCISYFYAVTTNEVNGTENYRINNLGSAVDTDLSLYDCIFVLQILCGLKSTQTIQKEHLDCNNDKQIDMDDVIHILQKSSELK